MNKFLEVKASDELLFKGVWWIESHWEFDHPTVIYSPIFDYSCTGDSIEYLVESICIDLILGDAVTIGMSKFDKKEFKWRGWDLETIKRKRKWQEHWLVKFYIDRLEFDMKKVK